MQKAPTKSATFSATFLEEVQEIAKQLDTDILERVASMLADVRQRGGRLFILGVGGSAANASHAVNDFRKLAGIEAYAPTDNVSELTARTNDEGWASVFSAWLQVSRLQARDTVLVFSVGGGNIEKNVSPNLVAALDYAKSVGAGIIGIVGRDGGYTARVADVCAIIPTVHPERITPHTEAFQAVVWHLLVSHPALQQTATRWESLERPLRKAVFLDRDGVLSDVIVRSGKPYTPTAVSDFRILPSTADELARLKAENFLLVVITNQPDVARGRQTRENIELMHRRLREELPVDDIFTCFHDDADGCDCRKPRPGLVMRAARKYGIDLTRSYFAGDRWRDVDAGANAGCKTILIDHGYEEPAPVTAPDARVESLSQAVDWILSNVLERA
jgi:D-sedoheptulose 7-phosphate isomerase